MAQSGKNHCVADLLTKGASQEDFGHMHRTKHVSSGKEMRNMSPSAHYIVLLKSLRDKQQVSILASQSWGG